MQMTDIAAGRKGVALDGLGFDHYNDQYMNNPYPVWAELRSTAPVAWSDAHNGYWLATTMEAVRAIALNPKIFSSRKTSVPTDIGFGEDVFFPPMQADPPEHTRMKRLLMPSFSQKGAESLREYTHDTVVGILDELLAQGGAFDAAEDFARLVPTAVVSKLLGLTEDVGRFTTWVRRLLGVAEFDPEAATAAAADMFGYISEVVQSRKGSDGDDLIRLMLATEIEGEKFDDMEVVFCAVMMVLAGIDTTWGMLSAAILHLGQNPDQQQRLRENPSGIELACEEFLRAFAPVTTARVLTTDTEINGAKMKKGDMVVVSFPSANRDETVFERADEVIIDRNPNRHTAFGLGAHRCLGVHIARMELNVALREFLTRVSPYTVVNADHIQWSRGQIRRPLSVIVDSAGELDGIHPAKRTKL